MASVNSPIRTFVKPFLFKILGKKGYAYAQYLGKKRDIKHRLVEEKEMALLPLIVKNGDAVIDIGANYGYYTERLSKLVGKEGKVYSFEPIPFTFSVCKMIVENLKLKNVELFKLGVSDSKKKITFSVPKLDFGGISAGQAHISGRKHDLVEKEKYYDFQEDELIDCDVVALDHFTFSSFSNLTFIKIDIEGAELFALKGMENLIKKFKPVILIEVQPYFLEGFNIDEVQFRDYINNVLGYTIYFLEEGSTELILLKTVFFDNNFILLPTDNLENFKSLIK